YPEILGRDVAQVLSALPAKSQTPAAIPQARPHGPRFLLVEKSADSTAISVGMPWTLSRADEDWPAMSIARSAFGEHRQFNGRLVQRLREARGLNYGDYAYIEHFRPDGVDDAAAQRGSAAERVNAPCRKRSDPAKLESVRAGSDMAWVKTSVLSVGPTPIHYQQDARGKTAEKPAAQLATDREIEKFPFGAKGDADVQ